MRHDCREGAKFNLLVTARYQVYTHRDLVVS
jgi:hypothetical protein